MENTCSERSLSASSDETECYLYPKRIKIESSQKHIKKEEQQKLEQSIHCTNRYQTSPLESIYLSERQNNWVLEKQSCDTARKTSRREFFHFQTCINKSLPSRVSENKLHTEKWSPENEDQSTTEDDISLNIHRQPLETELLSVKTAGNTCENPPQVQPSYNIEQNNKANYNHKLKQSFPVTPLNKDLFQMEFLSRKSVSDKKWEQYQLLPIPFLCGTSSVFSHTEHEKNNFLKKGCSAEDKDYSSSDNESTTERVNKEKNNSSYIIPTLKPFKSIQPLEIPNFLLASISNKINGKTPSTNLKQMDWMNSKSQPSLMQPIQMHGVQKMSEMGKQKLQNAKNKIKASNVDSEFKEKNYSSINKQEHGTLTGGKGSVTYFRDNSNDIECNQIFAGNDFKDEMLENSDADDDHKSKIHIYISAKNVQNEKCVSCNDLLKRMGRKSGNQNAGTFHTQTRIPVITEPLEKQKLDILCSVHNSNSDTCLYEAESKLSTKEILDFKRYITKNITFENICPRIIVQNFPDTKVSCNIFRGKKIFNLKFSFQYMLFGWLRTWTESLCKDMSTCRDDSVTPWLHFPKTLNVQELIKSNRNRNHSSKIFICLLTIISKHLKAELQNTILSSFSNSTNTFLPTEGKPVRVEKHALCGSKQDQLTFCVDKTLRQNTEFHKEKQNCPGFMSLKFVESIELELHNECRRSHFSRSLDEGASTFQKRVTLFHNQKSGLCKGRHVRKHCLLSKGSEGFSTCLRSVSHKNSKKKQTLVAKCLILLEGTFDCSSLDKMDCCSLTKLQDLIGANLRFWSYFLAHSQLKFEMVNSKRTNQEISITTVKQEKKKQSKMFDSSFHGESFRAFPFVLCENKKDETTESRNCLISTNEVTYTTKKYLGSSSCINGDKKECVKSKEIFINSHNFLSKKSFSIFDTYEKIPITTDSEDFDQIPIVNQDNSVRKKLSEENAVISSKEVHNLPAKSNDILTLPAQSKRTMEKCSSLLFQDSQASTPEYCRKIDTYNPHLANTKVQNQNTDSDFENLFPGSSNVFQPVTLPLGSSSFVDRVVCGDEHCGSSSSSDKQKQSEKIHAPGQYPSTGSPTVTEVYVELQGEEPGHAQTNKAGTLEPAALKQHLEYAEEQEEINDEQMHVTNERQCETLMNDLIMSYSEDESKTFIAAEEKLKVHLSIMYNGCLEDVKDKYLPLENKITYEFELKRKFGLVLEELRMFHEISRENENNLSSLETNLHNYCEINNSERIDENVTSASQKKICFSSPICGSKEGQNITDSNESSLNEKISNENEDLKISKEYDISRLSSEESLHSPVAESYFDAAYKKAYTWNPAFLSCTLHTEQNYNLQEEGGYFLSREVIRVQPLKTCKGPIRIGLSKKARLKHLHPYLK